MPPSWFRKPTVQRQNHWTPAKKRSSSKIVDFFRTAFGAFIRRSELFPAKCVPDIRASQKQGKEGGLLK
jgi:hypothetical protein